MAHIVERLHPGQDLRNELARIAKQNNITGATIASLVGSLKTAAVRLAGADGTTIKHGPVEIVSATGTISADSMHIHISVSDAVGTTYGGHLVEGCIVHTTVEVVLAEATGWEFQREHDDKTGYPEFKPRKQ